MTWPVTIRSNKVADRSETMLHGRRGSLSAEFCGVARHLQRVHVGDRCDVSILTPRRNSRGAWA